MATGRYRERGEHSYPTQLGRYDLIWVSGVPFFGFPFGSAYSPETMERCWDQTNPFTPVFDGTAASLRRHLRLVRKSSRSERKYRSGGPFRLLRGTTTDGQFVQGRGKYVGNYYPGSFYELYTGGFAPNGFAGDTYSSQDIANLGTDGYRFGSQTGSISSQTAATAYAQHKPSLQIADLGQALFEIREIPSMLAQSAKGFANIWRSLGGHATGFGPKPVADHFINHQFGWRPFLKDLGDLYNSKDRMQPHLRQLARDNGKNIRRAGSVDESLEESSYQITEGEAGLVFPALPASFYRASAGSNKVTSVTHSYVRQRTWFEGVFRYWVPSLIKDDDSYYHAVNVTRSLGLHINPLLLWKITPWSWLADWFSNTGDVISNAQDGVNNMVANYAYTMRHISRRNVNDSTIRLKDGDVRCYWTQEVESKTRVGTNPFGIGLDEEFNISPRQIAILAALGISRG